MTEENINALSQMGFKKIDISWIGKVKNYFISILDKQDSENELVITVNFAPNENKSKIFEFFDNMQTEGVISEYGLDKDRMSVTFLETENSSLETFLTQLANNFDSIGLCCKCSCCEETENLSYFSDGINYRLLCDSCANKYAEDQQKYKKKQGKYFRGFLASLIGALIGSLVWIIIGMLGFVASIAGVAISYCAFKGYEIAGGKVTRKGIILNVVAIVLAFLTAQYIGVFLEVRDEISFLGYILITPYIYTDWEFIQSVLPNFGLGLFFAFLGCYGTISKNYKAAKYADNFKIEKVEF